MKIVSLKDHPALIQQALTYCKMKWENVFDSFRDTAESSLTADTLPQTYIVLVGEDNTRIIGFCQLEASDCLTVHTELSPFVTTLFVDPMLRGAHIGIGEMLLTHARYEAARLGYERLYVCTDHIGYYERYGFHEIGLDIFTWGRACKIYGCDTPSEITFRRFDRLHPRTDAELLEYALARWNRHDQNPAVLLRSMKHDLPPESHSGKWFQLAAYKDNELVGAVNFMRDPDDALRWYLGDLFVAEKLRRHGIAKKLLTRGLEELRREMSGGERVHAVISPDNEASIRLHQQLGFCDLRETVPFCDLIFGENDTTWELSL
ncbi:MAG: GNAT family N-acetyltransferase [Oscillospiraceae bacterium]|nr:GNAT family N-acetyltransferase [Oscillospiraceae bacterium]